MYIRKPNEQASEEFANQLTAMKGRHVLFVLMTADVTQEKVILLGLLYNSGLYCPK